ncbi:aminopeptidase N [Brevibacterium sp. XM4083]|uniref:aminopeptidase N n=1 Tax=Brevibacterium sp. XM4083 TaxID=2583238 RepID=UPI001128DE59|nr:aminopeptidase N [Brevibacterium sp. XM4083]MCM1011416.1 aminopeptidase N [Brevibacterium sp. XM4083]
MTTNLTRDEAQSRSHLLKVKTYTVHLDVSNAESDADTYLSRTVVEFKARADAQTFIDLIADSVSLVQINGEDLSPAEVFDGARITFPVREGKNTLTVEARARYSTSGEGLHRFTDPADGKVYLYSQFEPTDARRVFANFDQPDLKAKFVFSVTAPEAFQVLSNQAETSREATGDDAVTHYFAPTLKQSSYITCITAGPYEGATDTWTDPVTQETVDLGVWTRASLVDHLDAADILGITKAGLDFFSAEFDYPYPWGKYDQIFVPEYNLGAMENPGLVTFTDAMIFRDKVTDAMYESRANVILHEMAHMWFGDLVTMKWWDDLWLKESFADYMGGLALAEATRFTDGWVTFALRRKAWAYMQDLYPTTHPIVADIPDVEAAKLNFDGITYAKGASVLKQLVAYVGREAFFAGSRLYFKRFAFGNTELADFLECLAEAAPERDIAGWADAWLGTSGVSELSLALTTGDDTGSAGTAGSAGDAGSTGDAGSAGDAASSRGAGAARDAARASITGARISQSDSAEGAKLLRPHTLEIATLGRAGRDIVPLDSVVFDFDEESAEVEQLIGRTRGDIALLNYGDHDYARVRLDEASTETAVTAVSRIKDPLSRALVWSALDNAVRDGLLPVQRYLTAYARSLGKESNPGIMAGLSQTALLCLDQWVAERNFETAISGLLGAALDALATAKSGSDAQLHLANLVLSLTARTARCIEANPSIAMGRAFATQVLTVPVGEEIDSMSPEVAEEAAPETTPAAEADVASEASVASDTGAASGGSAASEANAASGSSTDGSSADRAAAAGKGADSGSATASRRASARAGASGPAEHAAASLPFRGLINDHALRWNALTALVSLGWADQTDIARETHLDQSSSGRLRAETASAALPLPIVKMRAWEAILDAAQLSNDVLSAIISGFVAPSALPITEVYVDEYFERLRGFWADNSIEIARRLVLGLYPRWSDDEEGVVERTDAWLDENADAPAALRRLLIERRDDLARAIFLKSRQTSRH